MLRTFLQEIWQPLPHLWKYLYRQFVEKDLRYLRFNKIMFYLNRNVLVAPNRAKQKVFNLCKSPCFATFLFNWLVPNIKKKFYLLHIWTNFELYSWVELITLRVEIFFCSSSRGICLILQETYYYISMQKWKV